MQLRSRVVTPDQILMLLFATGGVLLLAGAFWTSATLLAVGGVLVVAAFCAGPALDRRAGR